MAILSSFSRQKDFGILVLRLGLGVFMILHGLPKLMGGPDLWSKVGLAMNNIGISFYPTVWGFLAGLTESLGGLLLVLGLWFRPACIFLLFTMAIAAINHLNAGDGWLGASHAFELLFVFFGLLFVGPGRHSVDKR